jgi:glutathione peroxidase-family protein
MKLILCALCSIWVLPYTSGVYNINFKGLENEQVEMSVYQSKKILITAFDAANPDRGHLTYLDSLYKADTANIAVIAIPATDQGDGMTEPELKKILRDTLALAIVISKPSKIKKNAGSVQHKLMKWLTHVSENGHFDPDIDEYRQIFLISRQGKLYAMTKGPARHAITTELLNQTAIQQP